MTRRKRQRLVTILISLMCLGGAAGLVLYALKSKITFFYTPADPIPEGLRVRLGGIVKAGSVRTMTQPRAQVTFTVTDFSKDITVVYTGLLPDLFREGQGVVAEGTRDGAGIFQAERILAKHDETYMPPDVADALKKKGLWRAKEKGTQP